MTNKLICPDCGKINTVYVSLGGLVCNKSNQLLLLQTCAGEHREDLEFPIHYENNNLVTTINSTKFVINKISDIGECGECGKKTQLKELIKK